MALEGKQPAIIFDPLPAGLSALNVKLFNNSQAFGVILDLSQLDAVAAERLPDWLHKEEMAQLHGYSYPKRQREYLGGRLCAKEGLARFYTQLKKCPPFFAPHQCYVAAEESGRPYFHLDSRDSPDFPIPQLSITHSGELGSALVSRSPCGIDIQSPAASLPRVKKRFCTVAEEQLLQKQLPRLSALSQLTLLWAGKEALKKMLSPGGIPGFHELSLQSITPQGDGAAVLHFSGKQPDTTLTVIAAILDNGYGIALCCAR